MSSNSFLVVSLRFSMHSIISSENSISFTSSFPNWILFIFLSDSCGYDFKAMLNKSGVSSHPCHFPDLRGKAFIFSPLNTMLVVGFSYMAFIMLRHAP